jgi:diaminopimelate decarboxylase
MSGFRRDAQGAATLGGSVLEELWRSAGVPSPAYFYDVTGMADAARALVDAFVGRRGLVAYAMKANSAGSILRAFKAVGAGADIVSGAELEVALGAGIDPRQIVMSGVAKADWEMDLALGAGIRALQLESVEEVDRLAARSRAVGKPGRVSLRVKPGVGIDSHAHIATGHDEAKFGIATPDLPHAYAALERHRDVLAHVGLSVHVGSMVTEPTPYLAAARVVCDVARARRSSGHTLEFLDFGGGYGIDYGSKPAEPAPRFVAAAFGLLDELGLSDLELIIEPGRSLVAPYGVLVAKVLQSKRSGDRRWIMIDAGMNDLIRPALYGARHRIEPLDRPPGGPESRVVGPVCESSDDFGFHALGEEAPAAVAIRDAGAYSFSMASEYNGRALPAEVFVVEGRVQKVSPSPGRSSWVARRLEA